MPTPADHSWIKGGKFVMVKDTHEELEAGMVLLCIKTVQSDGWGSGEVIYAPTNAAIGRIINFPYDRVIPVTRDCKKEIFQKRLAELDKRIAQIQTDRKAVLARVERLMKYNTEDEEKKDIIERWKSMTGTDAEKEQQMMADLKAYEEARFADLEV